MTGARSGRPRKHAGRARPRPHLAALSTQEKGELLDELLRARPELSDVAEEIARRRLTATDRDGVAEDVEWNVKSHSHLEIGERAGRQPSGGYVDPTEAAWEILHEDVEPHLAEIGRLAKLGLDEAARETGLGVLAGLYACEGEAPPETVLEWTPDFPQEAAWGVMGALKASGVALDVEAIEEVAPGWAAGLLREG